MRSLLQENGPHGDKVTPLIQKDSMTHLHGLAGFLKERVPFAKDISLDNAEDSFLYFRVALLHSVPHFL